MSQDSRSDALRSPGEPLDPREASLTPVDSERLRYCPICRRYVDPASERIVLMAEVGKGTRIRHGSMEHPIGGPEDYFKTLALPAPERW